MQAINVKDDPSDPKHLLRKYRLAFSEVCAVIDLTNATFECTTLLALPLEFMFLLGNSYYFTISVFSLHSYFNRHRIEMIISCTIWSVVLITNLTNITSQCHFAVTKVIMFKIYNLVTENY